MKWTPIAHTLVDILRGLMYLHDMDIIHGDIKAANVMLKSVHKTVSPVKFTAKLADLGLAQLRGDAVCCAHSFCVRMLVRLISKHDLSMRVGHHRW